MAAVITMFEFSPVSESIASSAFEARKSEWREACIFARKLCRKAYCREDTQITSLVLFHRYGVSIAAESVGEARSRSPTPTPPPQGSSQSLRYARSVASNTSLTTVSVSPLWHVACGCVFLASKLEEDKKKAKHVANAALAIRRGVDMEDIPSGDIDALVKCILECERDALYASGYSIVVRNSRELIIRYFEKYVDASEVAFKRRCMGVCRDALLCNACVCFPRKVVAAAIIAISAKSIKKQTNISKITANAIHGFENAAATAKTIMGAPLSNINSVIRYLAKHAFPLSCIPDHEMPLLDEILFAI